MTRGYRDRMARDGTADAEASDFSATWEKLSAVIRAAHASKRRKWWRLSTSLWREESWMPGILAGIVLKLQIIREAGPEPSSEDISRLARRIQDPYQRLTGGDTASLIHVLHTVFDRAPQGGVGKELIPNGSAVVGLLLSNATRLQELRPEARDYLESVRSQCELVWARRNTQERAEAD